MTQYFLGVDGGQSSTTAIIADENGHILHIGKGGPCNHVKTGDGRAKFENAILGCLGSHARLRFRAACLGFSGGPKDKEALVRQMIAAEQYSVTNDGLIALTGATGGEPGIIVVGGTGSIAYGRNARGELRRAGGWGYIFGDEGGGFDITREAVRASLRMEEGWGPATSLREKLLAMTHSEDANDLVHRLYTSDFPRPLIASYSKLVDQAAREGDPIAIGILNRAAQALAGFASSVRSTLFAPDEKPVVCPVGNVYNSEILRARFEMLVENTQDPLYGPASGALIEAWRMAGNPVLTAHLPKAEK
ncbi:BadF/BadG/BcrA/BcrD ATPase family protein [Bryobacter aggregatus]|uniref:BadF/BadG/BcrA/BcrD ATPase family protein n=1 Tax=Bryobacter aggregatus TaxID=360054 RepID=UPI0004E170E5|nr:BadF/BadG/BcrA/BcrD ATPase family protein [Bryobacter aggregatus]